jgi:hypothetical protein
MCQGTKNLRGMPKHPQPGHVGVGHSLGRLLASWPK